VLGKVMQCSLLSTSDLDKLKSYVTDMDDNKCVVYGRVVLLGVLYTSGLYHRSEVTNDSVVRLRTAEIGTVQKFVSCCQSGCTCSANAFCGHYIIVSVHPSLPFNQTAESAVQHVVQIGNST
jgi:hypothetical protein